MPIAKCQKFEKLVESSRRLNIRLHEQPRANAKKKAAALVRFVVNLSAIR